MKKKGRREGKIWVRGDLRIVKITIVWKELYNSKYKIGLRPIFISPCRFFCFEILMHFWREKG